MNLLLEQLPSKANGYSCNTDFRIMVQFELLLQEQNIDTEAALKRIFKLFYISTPPSLEKAVEGLLWFYRCGKSEEEPPTTTHKSSVQAYSFAQDAGYIYAAFLAQYGIDLTAVKMHWWKFRALFSALESGNVFTEIMGYRTVDTKGMGRRERAQYERLKKIYALKNTSSKSPLTCAEYNQQMLEYVDRRYQENKM